MPILNFTELESFSQELILSMKKENNGDIQKNYTGISFVEFVNQVEYLVSSKDAINPHWDTQLPRDVKFRIPADFIVRQESLNSDLDKLSDFLGKPRFNPVHKNKTVFSDDIQKIELGDMSKIKSVN